MELNNNNNNNRAEWKIQLITKNNFISISVNQQKFFTENIIDTLFNTILNKIQQAMKTSNEKGSGFTHNSVGLLCYNFQIIDIRKGESCIMSPVWIANKKATINPKNEKDNERFESSIIAGLNYNKIKQKELKTITKI